MKVKLILSTLLTIVLFSGCKESKPVDSAKENYLDFSQRDDQFTGGIKMIPISTPIGKFNVWTKRVGNNPKIKVLLLHGGPGGTHEFFESFDGFFPQESIEYILSYLNNPVIFDWLKCNGIVKGNIVEFSEKPISSIPFRVIDWSNENEVELHNSISEQTKNYLKNQDKSSWTPALTSLAGLFHDSLNPSLIWRRDDGTAVAFRVVGAS